MKLITLKNRRGAKYLKVQDTHEARRERFKISREIEGAAGAEYMEAQFDGRNIQWAKQLDATSCGYCALCNISNTLGLSEPRSVSAIYRKIREMSENPSQREANLNGVDLRLYLNEVFNMSVNCYGGVSDLSQVELLLVRKDFDVLVLTSGGHYTVIINDPQGADFYLLDSLYTEPRPLTGAVAMEMIKNSVGVNHNRANLIMKGRLRT